MGNIYDHLIKREEKLDYSWDDIDWEDDLDGLEDETPPIFQHCAHKWKWYNSLFPNNSFQFCELCDEKKDKK